MSLGKIKSEAKKFSSTIECRRIILDLDKSLLTSLDKELKFLIKKWKSIDKLSKRLLSRSENENEGLAGEIILSSFGIHAFLKLLYSLRKNHSFLEYLDGLFRTHWERPFDVIRSIRDFVISIIFIIYVLSFLIMSKVWSWESYSLSNQGTKIAWRWDGISGYEIMDPVGKKYTVKPSDLKDQYGVYYGDVLIGSTSLTKFYDLSGRPILKFKSYDTKSYDTTSKDHTLKLDLENSLKGINTDKVSKKIIEIDRLRSEIDSIGSRIDSIGSNLYESVDMSKKIFKEYGLPYDEIIRSNGDASRGWSITMQSFAKIKNVLSDSNNIGYLEIFAKMSVKAINSIRSHELSLRDMTRVYNLIKENEDILKNLRDANGNICSIFTLWSYEEITDSLERLSDWRKVNKFIKEFPSAQKKLIWKNGYYTDKLKNKSQSLNASIIKIGENENLKNIFLSKISSLKTEEDITRTLYRLTNDDPWNYYDWYDKLNNTRNVYISWASESENQIICIVSSYTAIKKIASGTNWCIVRSEMYFDKYTENGPQCILYDFNQPQESNDSIIGFSLNNEFHKYHITDCHDKSDRTTMLPIKFRETQRSINPKYIKIDIGKAILKLDKTSIKVIKDKFIDEPLRKIQKTLNKPTIKKIVDFY